MSARRVLGDERGASLVIALAFLTFMSVFCVSIVAFAGVGGRTSTIVGERLDQRYAADAGMEYALANVVADPSKCASAGPTSSSTIPAVNGRTVTYSCVHQSGGNGITGSNLMGGYGTIITGTNGISYSNANADDLVFGYRGSVHSDGPVSFGNAADQTMAIDGDLTVAGSCPPSVDLFFVSPGACRSGRSEPPVAAMSVYVPGKAPASAPTTSGSCTTIYPGKYGSGGRTQIPTFSATGQYYLASGVYYLNSATFVLKGTVFGGARPAGDSKLVTSMSPCRSNDPSSTGYSGAGVTFILGGTAELRIEDAATEVELYRRVPGGDDEFATPGIGIWSGGSAPTYASGSGGYASSTAATPFSTNHADQDIVIHGLTRLAGTTSSTGQVATRVHANIQTVTTQTAVGDIKTAVFRGGLVATRLSITVAANNDARKVMIVAGSGGFSASPRVVTLTSTAPGLNGAAPTTITATVAPDGSTPVISAWRVT